MQRFIYSIILGAGVVISGGMAQAGTIDFGDLAGNTTYNLCGDGQNIGSFYASEGVANIGGALGDPVNSLDTACRQSLGIDAAYPAIGSDISLFSQDDGAVIQFTSLVSSVSLEYVALNPIELTAYDSLGDELAQSAGSANTDGTDGSDSPISVSAAGIAYVTLGNVGLADGYTFDELSFTQETSGTPEPATWVLTAFGFAMLRRVRKHQSRRYARCGDLYPARSIMSIWPANCSKSAAPAASPP